MSGRHTDVLLRHLEGESVTNIARALGVSRQRIYAMIQQARTEGEYSAWVQVRDVRGQGATVEAVARILRDALHAHGFNLHKDSIGTVELEFGKLSEQWHHQTGGVSRPADIISNPAYLSIIALGPAALSYIFREMQEHGGYWYPALTAITREQPVPPEDRGFPKRMRAIWLQWARKHNYLRR